MYENRNKPIRAVGVEEFGWLILSLKPGWFLAQLINWEGQQELWKAFM